MEQMIARADFMHTNENDMQHEFTAACTRWLRENRDSITVQQAQAILRALQDKVCRPDFPSQGTSGFHMAFHLLKELQSVISDLIDDGKASQADFQGAYLEFILQMIQAGLNSSHIDYTFLLRDDRNVNFKEYFQTLRGEALCRVVRLLKKEYIPDPGMDWRTFYSRSFDKFYRVFICDGLSTEQFQEAHREFLDLYVFFNLGFKGRDQETRKATMEFAHRIANKYDRNIFKGLKDVGLLTGTLEELSEINLEAEFPQAQDVDNKLKDDLSNILKAVSEEGLFGSMYDVILDLALNLTVRKAGCEETREYFEVIGRFFFHIKKESVSNNGELFEGLVKKFIYLLDHVKDEVYLTFRFVEPIMENCLNEAMGT
ncbi:uncharacterized protein [Littorina saxatilis]|uniref:uncharacterized protein n=1 Tax=Littorina saxatilis TaxID=31220 RepID=UPI0038B46797